VTSGRRDEWTGTGAHPAAVVSPPVWRASTHLYPNMRPCAPKPARTPMAASITAAAPHPMGAGRGLTLEPGAAGTVLYPSGVAAIAGVLLTVLKPGDVLLMTDNAYEPSRASPRVCWPRWAWKRAGSIRQASRISPRNFARA
jgi:cystathionine beta-lyase